MERFDNSECQNGDCDAPMPWDMPQIGLLDDNYCSPECALEALDGRGGFHGRVWLHDPQYGVRRENFGDNITKGDVDISRHADSVEAASNLVQELKEIYNGEFRYDPQ